MTSSASLSKRPLYLFINQNKQKSPPKNIPLHYHIAKSPQFPIHHRWCKFVHHHQPKQTARHKTDEAVRGKSKTQTKTVIISRRLRFPPDEQQSVWPDERERETRLRRVKESDCHPTTLTKVVENVTIKLRVSKEKSREIMCCVWWKFLWQFYCVWFNLNFAQAHR